MNDCMTDLEAQLNIMILVDTNSLTADRSVTASSMVT